MFVPVLTGDGQVGDVRLLRVVGLVAVRLRGLGHWRRLRGEILRIDGHHAGSGLVRGHDVVKQSCSGDCRR